MDMSATTVIARSRAEVFAFVSDVINDVHWRTGVTEAGFTTEPPLRVGSEGNDLAGRTQATWRVVAFDESTAVDWVLTSGPFGGIGGCHLEPADGGTRFTLVADVEPKGAYHLLGPLFARMEGNRTNPT